MLNLSLLNSDEVPVLSPMLPNIDSYMHYIKVRMERLQVVRGHPFDGGFPGYRSLTWQQYDESRQADFDLSSERQKASRSSWEW